MEADTIDSSYVEELGRNRGEPDWLRERRERAWESYEGLPAPRVIRTPGKRWTDLGDLDVRALAKATETADVRDEIEAPGEVTVEPLSEAVEHHEAAREHLNEVVRWDENRYTAVHAAAWTDGLFVHVPAGVEASDVVRTTAEVEGASRLTHTLVVAEENSRVAVAEATTGGDESYLSNVVEVVAEDGAQVDYASLQNLSDDSYQYTTKRGVAGRDAEVNWIDGCFGTALTKSTVATVIEGEGASTANLGLFYGADSQHFDVETWTDHRAPNTTCDMFTRGVVDERAVAAYEGTIRVAEDAPDVDAYQTENVLMVSDEAEADASPRLEIDNNDVKCSHAATVGKVDEEELFYMNSRGIDTETAKRRIVEGFFEPVLGRLSFTETEDEFRAIVERKME